MVSAYYYSDFNRVNAMGRIPLVKPFVPLPTPPCSWCAKQKAMRYALSAGWSAGLLIQPFDQLLCPDIKKCAYINHREINLVLRR